MLTLLFTTLAYDFQWKGQILEIHDQCNIKHEYIIKDKELQELTIDQILDKIDVKSIDRCLKD